MLLALRLNPLVNPFRLRANWLMWLGCLYGSQCMASLSPDALNPSPDSPFFCQGFADGCDSGRVSHDSGTVRDDFAFRFKPAYRAGWQEGYAYCYPDLVPKLADYAAPNHFERHPLSLVKRDRIKQGALDPKPALPQRRHMQFKSH